MTVRKLRDGVKVTLNLDRPSYEKMKELHPTIGAAGAIRELVKNYVAQTEAKRARVVEELVVDLD